MIRDQFLCEKVMGQCWHDFTDITFIPAVIGTDRGAYYKCKCGDMFVHKESIPKHNRPNYSTTPKDILALQQFVMGADWWPEFWHFACQRHVQTVHAIYTYDVKIAWLFSDPDRLATLVATFGVEVLKLEGWKP